MAKIGMSKEEYLYSLVDKDTPIGRWYFQHKKIQEQLERQQQDNKMSKDIREAAAAAIKEEMQKIFERK